MNLNLSVELKIKPEVFQSYYQGRVSTVTAISGDGRHVRFPASILRPFVTKDGVAGHFVLEISEKGKLISIKRLST